MSKLRSDYILYLVGVFLLVTVGYALYDKASLEAPMGGFLIYSAIVFVLALFGITFLIFGYSMRPKKQRPISIAPSLNAESLIELTRIKGIGENRAEHLKALGVNNIADLSTAAAEELANKLQISSKTANQWVQDARNLLLKK